MAKISGLSVRLFDSGVDLSGDTSALSGFSTSQELLPITALDDSSIQRIGGVKDATLTVNGWFDAATSHTAYINSGTIPTTDKTIIATMGTSRGDPALGGATKEGSYDVDRQPGNAVATVASFEASDGYPFEWGVLLTDGPAQTDSSATNSTAVDNSASSADGAYGILNVISVGSGTCDIAVQTSSDNVSFSDYLTFTGATGATHEIVRSSSACGRYARVKTSGTFTDCKLVLMLARL